MKRRTCPTCDCDINYSSSAACVEAEKAGRCCRSCSKKGKKHPRFGNKLSAAHKEALSIGMKKMWIRLKNQ